MYSLPKSVSLNLTNRCNLKCIHCMNSSEICEDYEMSFENYKKIINEINKLKIFRIDITGGEPLIRKDFREIVNLFDGWQSLFLNTNATLIDIDMGKFISKKFRRVAVSIDGVDEKHDLIRGKNAFRQTVNGLDNLRKFFNINNIYLTCTVSKLNLDNVKEVILWAIHNGYKHLGFNVCKELGRAENSEILLNFKEKVEVYYLLNMLNEEYGEQISIKYGSFYSYFHTLERMTHIKNENFCDTLLPCKAGTESCAILYDGYVVPCNSLSKIQSSSECNILKHSLKQIWESSEMFIKWRELLNIKVSDVCKQCALNLICTGGCRAQALIENDNLFNIDRDICLAYQLGYR